MSIQDAVDAVREKLRGNRILIGIGGDTASGKTSLALYLHDKFTDSLVISTDGYLYPAEERKKKGHTAAHPKSMNMALIHEHLALIRKGEPFAIPLNPENHEGNILRSKYTPCMITIVEGMAVFMKNLVHEFDVLFLVQCPRAERVERCLMRDVSKRGRSREEVLLRMTLRDEQYATHIQPQEKLAHTIIEARDVPEHPPSRDGARAERRNRRSR